MNTLIENDGAVTRIRLIAANPIEKLALATIGDEAIKGQALVFRADGADWVLELKAAGEERKAANGA